MRMTAELADYPDGLLRCGVIVNSEVESRCDQRAHVGEGGRYVCWAGHDLGRGEDVDIHIANDLCYQVGRSPVWGQVQQLMGHPDETLAVEDATEHTLRWWGVADPRARGRFAALNAARIWVMRDLESFAYDLV